MIKGSIYTLAILNVDAPNNRDAKINETDKRRNRQSHNEYFNTSLSTIDRAATQKREITK